MKLSAIGLIVASITFRLAVQAQTDPLHSPTETFTNSPPSDALTGWGAWNVVARDECSTTREFRYHATNAVTGQAVPRVHTIIAVGNGMNYLDASGPNGEWRESKDLIALAETGCAAAVYGPHKLYCEPDLSSETAITIITKSNRVFFTHPQSIELSDPGSGRAIELATVNPLAVAELHPPNQVIWKKAFDSDSVTADFRITYTGGGIEADVIYTRRIRTPEECSPPLDASRAQLQVRHVFVNAPPPSTGVRRLGPDLTDETLDFGDLWFPTGTAFFEDGVVRRDASQPARMNLPWFRGEAGSIPVGKTWKQTGGVAVLMESVSWKDIAPQFNALPEIARDGADADSSGYAADDNNVSAAKRSIKIASAPYEISGVVMDWQSVTSGTDKIFETYTPVNGKTYYIENSVSFSGNVTFMEGCVIKYKRGTYLMVNGTMTCSGTIDSPSVLTSRDDPLFGETALPEYTGCPAYAAYPALWCYSQGGTFNITGMRIRYATTAIRIDTEHHCSGAQYFGIHTVIENCRDGIVAPNDNLSFNGLPSCSYRDVVYPTSACAVWGYFLPETSLTSDALSGTQGLTAGHIAPDDLYMYTHTGAPNYFVTGYNANCWISGVPERTSLSFSNSGSCWYQGAGTLVSRRIAVTANHMGPNNSFVGREFRWIGTDGQPYVSTCVRQTIVNYAGMDSDAAVLLFSPPLPDAVRWVKVLPQAVITKAPYLHVGGLPTSCPVNTLPCITTHGNERKTSYAIDLYFVPKFVGQKFCALDGHYAEFWAPWMYAKKDYCLDAGWGRNEPFTGFVGGGDSGQPCWVYLNNELVLATTWSCSEGAGPFYGFDISKLNAAIDSVSLSYGVAPDYATPAALSMYPDTK